MPPSKNRHMRKLLYVCIGICLSSCGVLQPYEDTHVVDLSQYRPVPLNRERGGLLYFNLDGVNRMRTDGVSVEILASNMRSELETTPEQQEFLQVLRYKDELFLFYDYPGSGPSSGWHQKKGSLKIHLRQPLSAIHAENPGTVWVRDLIHTPFLEIYYDQAATVKCDAVVQEFRLLGARAASFQGWIEAKSVQIQLQQAAVATMSGRADDLSVSTVESAAFSGQAFNGKRVRAQASSRSRIQISAEEALTISSDDSQVFYRALPRTSIRKKALNHGQISAF